MGAICDKHELSNCAECSGAAARLNESLKEPTHWQTQRGGPLPRIEGGPTIYAKFAGNCAGCGRRYQPAEPIHYDSDVDGWVAVECCVTL